MCVCEHCAPPPPGGSGARRAEQSKHGARQYGMARRRTAGAGLYGARGQDRARPHPEPPAPAQDRARPAWSPGPGAARRGAAQRGLAPREGGQGPVAQGGGGALQVEPGRVGGPGQVVAQAAPRRFPAAEGERGWRGQADGLGEPGGPPPTRGTWSWATATAPPKPSPGAGDTHLQESTQRCQPRCMAVPACSSAGSRQLCTSHTSSSLRDSATCATASGTWAWSCGVGTGSWVGRGCVRARPPTHCCPTARALPCPALLLPTRRARAGGPKPRRGGRSTSRTGTWPSRWSWPRPAAGLAPARSWLACSRPGQSAPASCGRGNKGSVSADGDPCPRGVGQASQPTLIQTRPPTRSGSATDLYPSRE